MPQMQSGVHKQALRTVQQQQQRLGMFVKAGPVWRNPKRNQSAEPAQLLQQASSAGSTLLQAAANGLLQATAALVSACFNAIAPNSGTLQARKAVQQANLL
jgi:hypothetical protein